MVGLGRGEAWGEACESAGTEAHEGCSPSAPCGVFCGHHVAGLTQLRFPPLIRLLAKQLSHYLNVFQLDVLTVIT